MILGALYRRQFLEPEAERCGVGKLTMRRIILSFLFFHFPFLRVYFAKKTFWRVVWLDGKKQFALQFLVPSSTKIRENTRALLDDGYNFSFYPKKEKLRFLSLSVCSVEGAPIEQFVLASASH